MGAMKNQADARREKKSKGAWRERYGSEETPLDVNIRHYKSCEDLENDGVPELLEMCSLAGIGVTFNFNRAAGYKLNLFIEGEAFRFGEEGVSAGKTVAAAMDLVTGYVKEEQGRRYDAYIALKAGD